MDHMLQPINLPAFFEAETRQHNIWLLIPTISLKKKKRKKKKRKKEENSQKQQEDEKVHRELNATH